MIFEFRHQVVRDLAWAIASPPLLTPNDKACSWFSSSWYLSHYRSSVDLFNRLDSDPGELNSRLANENDRRLGKRFETLWSFWLEKSPNFEVIAQNLPLRDGDRTLGELDYLLIDKTTGRFWHWEVAVKFYLGVGDTQYHGNWHGPGKKDRLDLKVGHLRDKQIMMSDQPYVREILENMNVHVDGRGIILKGRFYYPGNAPGQKLAPLNANPEHLKGEWKSQSMLLSQHSADTKYLPLLGRGWLANIEVSLTELGLTRDALLEALNNGDLRLPLYVAYATEEGPPERLFIVPDDWDQGLK